MNIPMFTYFDIYAVNNQIDYHFSEINMFQKEWISNTTSEKKVVSTHPPLEEIKITAQGVEIIASPFKTTNTKDDDVTPQISGCLVDNPSTCGIPVSRIMRPIHE